MSEDFTYPEVGGTAWDELPSGYHVLDKSRTIGRGREDFDRASHALAGWEMHRRAGVGVPQGTPRAAEGTEVLLSLGLGPARIAAPCRVVYVINDHLERGFAYGTLPSHPESGEERFAVVWDGTNDGPVEVRIRAFSRPNKWWTRVGGPLARAGQRAITRRYLRALDTCA